MTTIKTVIYALIAGLTIGGIWNLQEINYTLGTGIGLALLAGLVVILAKKGA